MAVPAGNGSGLMDAYATHLEILVETALNTTGAILELGCGDYSTPVLSAIAKFQGRQFTAQASSPEWAARLGAELVDWRTWKPSGHWGMVFLDSEESVINRMKRLPELADITEVVVMHDADTAIRSDDWEDKVKKYASCSLYEKHKPWTAVLRVCGH